MESGSNSMISGGELSVENVSTFGNQGVNQNISQNAQISTFNKSVLNTFLKYPTILYDGTINTSTLVGTTIYATSVSPTLLQSTTLSRITNFSTNFRQWNGCMKVRMIFTKPVFVQTKVIVAFIPGMLLKDADTVTIPDMYGAQFHAVMNPDNEAELSFDIPFISGKMWHDMSEPTGIFLVKLFQPLIASQPTGTSAVSIPFTITISSSMGGDLPALDFRFLVAPLFQNSIVDKDAKLSVLNSIAPNVDGSSSQALAGIIPSIQTLHYKMKSLIILPIAKYNQYISEQTIQTPGSFINQQAVSSLNLTKDFLPPATMTIYDLPFNGLNLYNSTFIPVNANIVYASITATAITTDNQYASDASGTSMRFLYVSKVQTAPVGTYVTGKVMFNWVAGTPTLQSICTAGTMLVTQLSNGLTSYLYNAPFTGQTPASTLLLDFSLYASLPFYSSTLNTALTKLNCDNAYSKLVSDTYPAGTTHVLLCSNVSYAAMQVQVANDNFVNCRTASMDQLAACYNERALQHAIVEQQDRADLLTILFAIKYGADTIATAARIVSNVVSYLIPVFTVNSKTVGPNQALVFDVSGTQTMTFILPDVVRTPIEYPPVTNASIAVIDL